MTATVVGMNFNKIHFFSENRADFPGLGAEVVGVPFVRF